QHLRPLRHPHGRLDRSAPASRARGGRHRPDPVHAMTDPRILPAGPGALLLELAARPGARPAELAAALRAHDGDDVLIDVVPAASTVLVTFAPEAGDAVHTLVRWACDEASRPGERAAPKPPLTIPVSYDGPDLAIVAERSGLSTGDVVARHSAAVYEVEFLGF